MAIGGALCFTAAIGPGHVGKALLVSMAWGALCGMVFGMLEGGKK